MDHPRQPDFLAHKSSLRLLQAATASVGVLCVVLIASLVVNRSPATDRQAAIGTLATDDTKADGSQETAAGRRPKPFSRGGMNSVAAGLGSDSVRYYDEQSGAAFSTDLRTGRTTTLSDSRLLGFVRTLWVPGKEQVVSLFEAKGVREYRSYDYRTDTVATIAQDVDSLALSPDGRSAVYVFASEDTTVIAVTDIEGAATRTILKTRMPSPTITWPKADLLLLTYHRHDRSGYDVAAVSTDGSFKSFIEDRENLEYVLSPDGRRMLLSYYTAGEGVRLWYRDLDNPTEFSLGIATSARKCAWHSGNTRITCGIPVNAELARDVPAEMMATTDDIVTIDIEAGTQAKIFGAERTMPLGVIDPVVTPSGEFISFINLFDRRLYSLEL